jgi:hypothetical protein
MKVELVVSHCSLHDKQQPLYIHINGWIKIIVHHGIVFIQRWCNKLNYQDCMQNVLRTFIVLFPVVLTISLSQCISSDDRVVLLQIALTKWSGAAIQWETYNAVCKRTIPLCVWYVQFDLNGEAQMHTTWVSQATVAAEAVVAVPKAQRFPSMFAWLFNRPHHSSTAHHCENPKLLRHTVEETPISSTTIYFTDTPLATLILQRWLTFCRHGTTPPARNTHRRRSSHRRAT